MHDEEAPTGQLEGGSDQAGVAYVPPDNVAIAEADLANPIANLSQDEKKRILRERARKLALKTEETDADEKYLSVIEFTLSHERYALEMQYIREVYPLKGLTRIPCTPSFVLGILNVRGQIMSVTDIREFFDLPKKEVTNLSRVLIVKSHAMEFGILADEVLGERKIPLRDVHSGLVSGNLREDFVRGVTKDQLIVLDAQGLLSERALVVHQEAGD
jgi:purine-binding chemotaxis protein CheW